MPNMFPVKPRTATSASAKKRMDKQQAEEAKGGFMGWVTAYMDGSAKMVWGWAQAGYRVFYADGSSRNYAAHVPEGERQTVSRGELRGVLHALLYRQAEEQLLAVMDSEYIFKGSTEWSVKRRRHAWRTASGKGASRPLGTDSVGVGAGRGMCTIAVDPLAFGGAGEPWFRCPSRDWQATTP